VQNFYKRIVCIMSLQNVEKITEEIKNRAHNEASQIIDKAKKEAESILQEAASKARQEKEMILSRGEQEAKQQFQKIISDARIRSKKRIMDLQEELIQKAFNEARQRLKALSENKDPTQGDYKEILYALIKESIVSIGKEAVVIFVNQKDRDLLTQDRIDRLKEELRDEIGSAVSLELGKDSISATGGAIVRSKDGEIEVNNTFEARFLRLKDTLRSQVAMELFNSGSNTGK